MKILLFALLGCCFFIGCSSDNHESISTQSDQKSIYLKKNLLDILKLSNEEIDTFKNSMFFDTNGALFSWNSDLLEKAYSSDKKYTAVLTSIIKELGGNPNSITVVDRHANEKTFYIDHSFENPDFLQNESKIKKEDWVAHKDYIKNNDGICTPFIGQTCIYVYPSHKK
ncbi:hypothetical protein H4K35_13895 [Myroides sp. NP-2]|uniref:hypothetical protein n=1 Tax=Myroides sp. NP-2 TaxID=2759945 RepID=UPI0015FE6CC0|nr:hypothetical protein [Myroides sp. NP-2]MBB1151190.1 hypothetical protein [Myroides sp. NP-2]